MNYPIPLNSEEIVALGNERICEETVAAAIAGVIQIARNQGQSLEELTAEVLAEDPLLDQLQRRWLSKIVTQAWKCLS
jgi:hypothetical protein